MADIPQTPTPSAENAENAFNPLLTTCDWNEEWRETQRVRGHRDDADYWNERSKTYTTKDSPNRYVEDFLRLADIRPGESVFDMGCGTGALSIPLAEAGHRVLAADFSAGMLKAMDDELNARHIHNVFYKQMSWEDNWDEFGMSPNMVDVAIASRSMAVNDLEDALMRLDNLARRRVCITMPVGSSPHTDERVLRELGAHANIGRDYLYAFSILANRGIKAEVAYIESERKDTFDSAEELYERLSFMVRRELKGTEDEARIDEILAKLRIWVAENAVPNETTGQPDKKGVPEKALRLAQPRTVTWAFISWNK